MTANEQIVGWLDEMQACVRAVDYDRAERIFAPDVVGFGTYASMVHGLKNLRTEQWRHIWSDIREFTFRLDELQCGVEGDLAWAACAWDSVGYRSDGTAFPRPGRMTVILQRREGKWLAIHTHFSLFPAR